jgi:hypothetical protein
MLTYGPRVRASFCTHQQTYCSAQTIVTTIHFPAQYNALFTPRSCGPIRTAIAEVSLFICFICLMWSLCTKLLIKFLNIFLVFVYDDLQMKCTGY